MSDKKEEAFLVDLTKLTKKHGIAIGGCGCCGSPHFLKFEECDWLDPEGKYTHDPDGQADVHWTRLDDEPM